MAKRSLMRTDDPDTNGSGTLVEDPPASSRQSKRVKNKLHLAVQFDGFSIGKKSSSLGFKVVIGDLFTAQDAYDVLSNARLQATLTHDEEQASLPGMGVEPLESIVEINGVRLSRADKTASGRMTFADPDLDQRHLAKFHHCRAIVSADYLGDAGNSGSEEDQDEATEE